MSSVRAPLSAAARLGADIKVKGENEGKPKPVGTTQPAATVPRKLRIYTRNDWLALGGAVISSFALVTIGYEHILDASGSVGFLICWYATFLALYAGLIRLTDTRHVVVERLVTTALWATATLVFLALASTVIFTFAKGWAAIIHPNFFTHDMTGVAPTAPLSQGGIWHAIVGSAIEVGLAVAVSVPLGIGTAIYMSEVGGRMSRPVRTVVESMTALPEILAGLFVYVVLIVEFGLPKSGLAAAVAMSVTMIPIIARAGEVALRVVPGSLREASHALGASHWRTVGKVVLPTAAAGLATATILAIARGIGETAIVLITSGASSFMNVNPASNPMNSLPLFIYTGYVTGQPAAIARAFGAASVLLTMVLVLFVIIRVLSRNKAVNR
jgi:phosphate transport system permease protein